MVLHGPFSKVAAGWMDNHSKACPPTEAAATEAAAAAYVGGASFGVDGDRKEGKGQSPRGTA